MYKCNFNNFKIDEYFVYEYTKCPFRAFAFSKEMVFKLANAKMRKTESVKSKKYSPYGEILEYKILKSIYYKAFELIKKKKKLSFEDFKKMSLVIIEKELALNIKKVFKDYDYQMKLKEKIYIDLEHHFNLLDESDLENSIENFITVNADLKEYLIYRVSKLNKLYQKTIPSIDWKEVNGIPYFSFNLITIKKTKEGLDLVITAPLKVDDIMVHRNYYFSFIIQYMFYFYPKEKLIKFFEDGELININKLIVYFPLEKKRSEYSFQNISGIFQEQELLKLLRIYLEALYTKTTDTSDCKYCENNKICFQRTNCKNKIGRRKIFKRKKQIKEIIL